MDLLFHGMEPTPTIHCPNQDGKVIQPERHNISYTDSATTIVPTIQTADPSEPSSPGLPTRRSIRLVGRELDDAYGHFDHFKYLARELDLPSLAELHTWLSSSSVRPHLRKWYAVAIKTTSRRKEVVNYIMQGRYHDSVPDFGSHSLEDLCSLLAADDNSAGTIKDSIVGDELEMPLPGFQSDVLLCCFSVDDDEVDGVDSIRLAPCMSCKSSISTPTSDIWAQHAHALVHSNSTSAMQPFHTILSSHPAKAYSLATSILSLAFWSIVWDGEACSPWTAIINGGPSYSPLAADAELLAWWQREKIGEWEEVEWCNSGSSSSCPPPSQSFPVAALNAEGQAKTKSGQPGAAGVSQKGGPEIWLWMAETDVSGEEGGSSSSSSSTHQSEKDEEENKEPKIVGMRKRMQKKGRVVESKSEGKGKEKGKEKGKYVNDDGTTDGGASAESDMNEEHRNSNTLMITTATTMTTTTTTTSISPSSSSPECNNSKSYTKPSMAARGCIPSTPPATPAAVEAVVAAAAAAAVEAASSSTWPGCMDQVLAAPVSFPLTPVTPHKRKRVEGE